MLLPTLTLFIITLIWFMGISDTISFWKNTSGGASFFRILVLCVEGVICYYFYGYYLREEESKLKKQNLDKEDETLSQLNCEKLNDVSKYVEAYKLFEKNSDVKYYAVYKTESLPNCIIIKQS